jgi:hypothetical protein
MVLFDRINKTIMHNKLILLIAAIVSSGYMAAQTSLVVSGDSWKYFNGSDPGATWKNVGFNDAAWLSGPSELGYGDGDEATTIPANYPTSYFRRVINVPNPALFTGGYNLAVKRDDGIVVYINGTEVYRDNMPAGTPTYATWAASTCADDGGTWLTSTLAAGTLLTGNNTIAVEVHQRNASSSDVTFNLTLDGLISGVPTLTRGPYLQMGTSNSMVVRWRTNTTSNSEVRYGTTAGSLTMSATNAASTNEHQISLTGLTPNTKYYYSIGTIGAAIQGDTNNYFYTHPPIGTEFELDVWVTGDCGTGYATQTSVLNQFLNQVGNKYIDAWLLVGDNAYNSGYDTEFSSGFFGPYQNSRLMKQTTIWPAPGNHDYYSAPNLEDRNFDYYKIFTMPTAGQLGGVASGTEAFYSYNIGNVHFVSLDSYGEEAGDKMYDTTGAQSIWLKQDLAANTQKWTVLYWHHPPYTKGSHNSDTEGDLVDVRQKFIRMVERYDVDLIICGHSHCYERSKLMKGHYGNEASFNAATHHISSSSGKYDGTSNSCPYIKDGDHPNNEGVIYMVSGSAGKFGGTSSGYPHNAMYYSNATNGGSTYLKFNENRLDVQFISDGGVVQDKFTILKDVNEVTHYTVNSGDPVNMDASWPGQYSWPHSGANTETVVANPTSSTNYTVTDQYGCITDSFIVTINPGTPPTASFTTSGNTICAGQSVTYTNTSINTTSFSWSFPGGTPNSGTTSPITVTYATAGTYTTTLTATNVSGTNTSTQVITVNANPTATATNTGSYCAGQTIQLNSSGSSTNDWVGPNAYNQTNVQNPSIPLSTVAMSGVYTVTVTSAAGCSATATTSVTVNVVPAANATNTGAYCVGQTIQLNSVGGSATDDWAGPNSYSQSNTQNPTIAASTPLMAGIYTVTVTNASGCTATATTSVIVNTLPTANATNTGPYCEGTTIQLNSVGGSATDDWAGPNSYSQTNTQNPTIASSTTLMAGIYTVTATNVAGCTATGTTSVTVNPTPVASASNTGPYCPGSTIQLNATGTGTYAWQGPNTFISTLQNPTIASAAAIHDGVYTVTVTNGNCSSTSTTTVQVSNSNMATASNSGPYCVSETISLQAISGGINYLWMGPASFTSTTQNPNITTCTLANAGTYTVVVTFTGGCSSSATTSLNIYNNPTAPIITAGSALSFCEGGSVQLTSSYNTGNVWSTLETTQSIIATASGTYSVVQTDLNGCTSSASATVTENPLPSVSLPALGVICENYSPIALTVGLPAGGTYTGTGVSAGVFDPAIAGNGVFNITYTFTDLNGCSNSSVSSIQVLPCTGITENNNQFLISAFPNPFSDQITISYHLSNSQLISMELTDANGKVISRPIEKQTILAGDHLLVINTSEYKLKDGMYFIKLISNNKIDLLKITYIGK